MEGQHVLAETGGAFRKHADATACAQFVDQALAGSLGRRTRSPFEEERAGPFGQPADHRPATYFILGEKSRGCGGVDGEDVDPRDVVGHQQALGRWRTEELNADGQCVEQLPRPARNQERPHLSRQPRQGRGRGQSPEQMQRTPAQADGRPDALPHAYRTSPKARLKSAAISSRVGLWFWPPR